MKTLKTKVLRNYKGTGNFYQEFEYINLFDTDTVLASEPICLCEFDKEYTQPLIVTTNEKALPVCFNKDELDKAIANTRRYFFEVKESGELVETEEGMHDVEARFSIDVDINYLLYLDGEFVFKESAAFDDYEGRVA